MLLSVIAPRSAPAQGSPTLTQDSTTLAHDSATAMRDGWIVGPLVGVPGAGTEAYYPLATLGYGATRLAPNRIGADFAIGTAPYALAFGVIPLAARVGLSVPIALGRDAFLIPSAGVSAVALAAEEVRPPVLGGYWGAAAVVAHGSVGLRAGITLHSRFANNEVPVWLAEGGIMRVPLPRLAH